MTERMPINTFMDLHRDIAQGYVLHDDESAPETHQDLLDFIGRFFELEPPVVFTDLRDIVDSQILPKSNCCGKTDLVHTEAAVLMHGLADPDAFVGSLPVAELTFFMPSPAFIKELLEIEEITK